MTTYEYKRFRADTSEGLLRIMNDYGAEGWRAMGVPAWTKTDRYNNRDHGYWSVWAERVVPPLLVVKQSPLA